MSNQVRIRIAATVVVGLIVALCIAGLATRRSAGQAPAVATPQSVVSPVEEASSVPTTEVAPTYEDDDEDDDLGDEDEDEDDD